MKRLLTIALVLFPLLMVAQDDLYFTPTKKKQTPKEERKEQNEYKRPAFADYGVSKRSDDEYNRRYSFSGDRQNAGGLYADESDTLLTARLDSVPAYDMDDPEIDYRYSRRLVRFHSPRYYSPYYWDLMYAYGAWDYLYDPWDPWYWHYGWGYGWTWGPWDCWYGGIWGWHHPYHWAYWGWSWGTPVFTTTIGSSYSYRPRGSYITTSHNGRGGTISRHRTNPAELRRGNVADVRSSGMRGSGLTARSNGMSGRQTSGRASTSRGTSASRGNSAYGSGRTSTARSGRTDYTGGRMSANRYGQRGAASGSSASRSYNNASSSSRSYTPSSSSRSSSYSSRSSSSYSSGSSFGSSRSGGSYSSGGGSFSSGGGGSFSGGGGGSRGGGGGGRR